MFILDIMCGNVTIPDSVANIVSMVIKAFYIGIPILLIIWGMLDLGKAVVCQKEEEIKKHQKMFFKRLISAILVFFIAVAVAFVIKVLAGADVPGTQGISECIEQLVDY